MAGSGGCRVPRCPLVFSAWVSLAAGFLLEFVAGSMYVFGGYAGDLRAILGINQKQIQLIGSLLNAGTWAGVLGGAVLDRVGPRTTAICGGLLTFAGYFALYLAAARIAFTSDNFFPLWCFCAFTAGQGGSFFVSLGLKMNLGNFSITERGQVVGALQAFFGISAGVCSLLQRTFFGTNVAGLLLSLALINSLLGGCVGLLVNSVTSHPWAVDSVRKHYAWRIRIAYIIGISVAIFILVMAILKQSVSLSYGASVAVSLTALVGTFTIVLIPIKTGPLVKRNDPPAPPNAAVAALGGEEIETVERTAAYDDFEVAEENSNSSAPHVLTGDSTRDVLKSIDFYLLFFIWLVCAGAGNAFVNNIYSIVVSKSYAMDGVYPPINQADVVNGSMAYTFVALFSSFNTLGRLGFGALSDFLSGRFPRAFFLFVASGLTLLAVASLMVTDLLGMFFLVVVIGLCYGGLFGLLPSLIADRFGEKNFGLNYGLAAIAPALGSIMMSTLTAGGLADYFTYFHFITIINTGTGVSSEQCIGSECFFWTFLIFTIALMLSTAAAAVFWWRAKRYNMTYTSVTAHVSVGMY